MHSPDLISERQSLTRLVGGCLVWDNHACMPLRSAERRFLPLLERCQAAGIDLITLPVGYGLESIEQHIRMLSLFRDWIALHPEQCRLVLTVADAHAAKAAGQIGICFNIEGMGALGGQVDLVRLYYDLGVRWMLIAYNQANAAGGGCLAQDNGLTDFGKQAIEAMNEVGMVLCCTHSGYRTAREAIDYCKGPMIFSHSNPRAIYDHPRNIPDELILACAGRGGVIGLNGVGIFLGQNDASIETFIRHVEHVLQLAGEDHVGIGTDYCFDQDEVAQIIAANPETFPPALFPRDVGMEMMAPWQFGAIARALSQRGYSQQTLSKLFGGNHLRIAQQVWK